ncbi:helix-turn-helix transcriptional regulator [Pseudoblastomonas halimionae]|uniref:AlpA family phage regulatory protein n=1 Tax=Alteriqipengyuania halimionae TaxID=1926630 RepID=A0A6I4U5U8_9SPHN|nr:AlpA family phage regulatory protein [Alteriqipengyuania halimionae]MXP09637.1 AlpA family phage regulatory protein [Alteriqipengyuania halimionae]
MTDQSTDRGVRRRFYTREHLHRLGVTQSPSTLLRLEAGGRWPKRVRIGDHSVAWLKDEVDAHLDKLAAEREAIR